MTTLLCMLFFPRDWSSFGYALFFFTVVAAAAATDRPAALERRILLDRDENSLAVDVIFFYKSLFFFGLLQVQHPISQGTLRTDSPDSCKGGRNGVMSKRWTKADFWVYKRESWCRCYVRESSGLNNSPKFQILT